MKKSRLLNHYCQNLQPE